MISMKSSAKTVIGRLSSDNRLELFDLVFLMTLRHIFAYNR